MDQNIPTQQVQTYYKYAGFWRRLIAFLVDALIFLLVMFALRSLIQLLTGQFIENNKGSDFRTIESILFVTYNVIALRFFGATFGKHILHLKVVNKDFNKPSLWQIIKRESLGRIISGLVYNLGYLWIAIDDKKQGWHDKLANTTVINTQPISYPEFLKLQENKRTALPYILILMGVFEIMSTASFLFVFSKLKLLFEESNVNQNINLPMIMLTLVFLLALAKIIFGFTLAIKQHKAGALDERSKKIGKIILIATTVAVLMSIPLTIISIILPIYKLTTSF